MLENGQFLLTKEGASATKGLGLYLIALVLSVELSQGIIKGFLFPESCNLSPQTITIQDAQKNYDDCKTSIKNSLLNVNEQFNSTETDKKIVELSAKISPSSPLNSLTHKAIEDIFSEVTENSFSQFLPLVMFGYLNYFLFALYCLWLIYFLCFWILL